MKEKFKKLPEFPNHLISNHGRILSLHTGMFMSPRATNGNRHLQVCLDAKKWMYVHRLVAMAFLKRKNKFTEVVMHLDDNPKNNRVDNLQWGTQYENMQTRWQDVRERNKEIKKQFYKQRKTYKGGVRDLIKKLADDNGITFSRVCSIVYS